MTSGGGLPRLSCLLSMAADAAGNALMDAETQPLGDGKDDEDENLLASALREDPLQNLAPSSGFSEEPSQNLPQHHSWSADPGA